MVASTVACYLPLFFAGILSSGAGIGGGSINVSIFLVIGQFPLATAIILSFCTLSGNLISQVSLNSFKSHPNDVSRPLIYWELVLFLVPSQLAGSSVGTILQSIIPESIIIVMALITLIFALSVTFRKFVQLYRFETLDSEYTSQLGAFITQNYSFKRAAFSDYDDTDYDEYDALTHENFDEEENMETLSPNDSRLRESDFKSVSIPMTNVKYDSRRYGLSALPPPSKFPWTVVFVVVGSWMLYCGMYYLSKREKICSWEYFLALFGLYPIVIIDIIWALYYVRIKQESENYLEEKGDVNFSKVSLLGYCTAAFVIGTLCKLLGLGGGELTGPLILSMKVLPQVSAATTSVSSLFNSAANVLYYLSKGRIPEGFGMLSFFIGMVSGVTGRMLAYHLTKSGRPSILVACLLLVLVISFGMNTYDLISMPRDFQYHHLCK